jgi:hypothetical protein
VRIARAVAFAIAIAAPLAIFLWLQPPAADRDGQERDAARDATHPPPSEAPPAPPVPRVPTPTREPAAHEKPAGGKCRIELDLRGPGDARLPRGRVYDVPSMFTSKEECSYFAWQPEAATIGLGPGRCTLVAEAESDDSRDAIPCGDLVSDPVLLDPEAPPPSPLLLRLHFRSGIFGKLLGAPANTPERSAPPPICGVRWQKLDPSRSLAKVDFESRGHDARLVRLAAGEVAYVVHDLEPGRYAVAARSDPVAPFESPSEVELGETMVRRDLSLGTIDPATMLHAVVQGLPSNELEAVSFLWLGGAREAGASEPIRARSDAPGSFWLAPSGAAARAQLQRVLDGTLADGERPAVALARDGAAVAAEALTSGQHEVRFVCDAPARLRVRLPSNADAGVPSLLLALAPASAATLLDAPPAASNAAIISGLSSTISDTDRTFGPLVPGDFVLVTWGQLHSELRHGEVWWPLARRDVAVKAGEQELAIDLPPLHPLEVRFDRERFGKDARVQVVLRSYPNWPLFAIPDEGGIAKFAQLPDGEYTSTVVGDMAGERDFTLPGTSQLRVEPTRREEH